MIDTRAHEITTNSMIKSSRSRTAMNGSLGGDMNEAWRRSASVHRIGMVAIHANLWESKSWPANFELRVSFRFCCPSKETKIACPIAFSIPGITKNKPQIQAAMAHRITGFHLDQVLFWDIHCMSGNALDRKPLEYFWKAEGGARVLSLPLSPPWYRLSSPLWLRCESSSDVNLISWWGRIPRDAVVVLWPSLSTGTAMGVKQRKDECALRGQRSGKQLSVYGIDLVLFRSGTQRTATKWCGCSAHFPWALMPKSRPNWMLCIRIKVHECYAHC